MCFEIFFFSLWMLLRGKRKRILARKEVGKELSKILLVLLVWSEFVKGESVLLNTAGTSVLFSTCGRICFLYEYLSPGLFL